MSLPLGLKDPIPGVVPLRLATYIRPSQLPTPPETFGHMDLVSDWGMLANGPGHDNPPEIPDGVGDCAIAGPMHQIMLNCAESKKPVSFSAPTAVKVYSDITGYVLGDSGTDDGTSIDQMAQYWLTQGILDDSGAPHRIVAFVDLNPGDVREFWIAMFLFQSAGLGFALPDSAEEQTNEGKPWDVVPGAQIVGGHYVPAFNKLNAQLNAGVSWGSPQQFTTRFFQKYNNQGVVVLDEEMLTNMRSVDGFDDQQLRDDIEQLKRERSWL